MQKSADDDGGESPEVCGMTYGARTAATSLVIHLVQKHGFVVPDYLKEKGKQLASEKRETLKTMFARMSDTNAVQKS